MHVLSAVAAIRFATHPAQRERHEIEISFPSASAGIRSRRSDGSAPQRQLIDRSLAQPGAGSPKSPTLATNLQSSIALSQILATTSVALPAFTPGLRPRQLKP